MELVSRNRAKRITINHIYAFNVFADMLNGWCWFIIIISGLNVPAAGSGVQRNAADGSRCFDIIWLQPPQSTSVSMEPGAMENYGEIVATARVEWPPSPDFNDKRVRFYCQRQQGLSWFIRVFRWKMIQRDCGSQRSSVEWETVRELDRFLRMPWARIFVSRNKLHTVWNRLKIKQKCTCETWTPARSIRFSDTNSMKRGAHQQLYS